METYLIKQTMNPMLAEYSIINKNTEEKLFNIKGSIIISNMPVKPKVVIYDNSGRKIAKMDPYYVKNPRSGISHRDIFRGYNFFSINDENETEFVNIGKLEFRHSTDKTNYRDNHTYVFSLNIPNFGQFKAITRDYRVLIEFDNVSHNKNYYEFTDAMKEVVFSISKAPVSLSDQYILEVIKPLPLLQVVMAVVGIDLALFQSEGLAGNNIINKIFKSITRYGKSFLNIFKIMK